MNPPDQDLHYDAKAHTQAMMERQEHTAGPWNLASQSLGENAAVFKGGRLAVCIADCNTGPKSERMANARLIVKAVNSHAALVEALQFVLSQLAPDGDTLNQHKLYSDCLHPYDDDKTVVDYIRASLTLAQGEGGR